MFFFCPSLLAETNWCLLLCDYGRIVLEDSKLKSCEESFLPKLFYFDLNLYKTVVIDCDIEDLFKAYKTLQEQGITLDSMHTC